MTVRIKQPARRVPDDLLEGYERRVTSASMPAAKLPEIMELRAIVRELLGHIVYQDEQLQEVATAH